MTVIILTQRPAQGRALAGIVPPGESVTRGAPSSVSRNRLAAGPIRMHFKRFQSRTFELFRMGGEYHCVTNDGVSHWWLFLVHLEFARLPPVFFPPFLNLECWHNTNINKYIWIANDHFSYIYGTILFMSFPQAWSNPDLRKKRLKNNYHILDWTY